MIKTIVIGLDGAGWELLLPWIENGSLPNIKKAMEKGVWGDLTSCYPPVSCPAWKCYSTGKNPGNLGVFWWLGVDWEKKRMPLHNSFSFRSRELWDYLNEEGIKTGIINMPTTYPPKKLHGFMITSWWAPSDKNFTYPPELEEVLREDYNYRIRPKFFDPRDKETSSKQIYELIETRFKVLKNRTKEKDIGFLHLTIFYINTLHHFFWDDEVVKKGWEIIDVNIAEIMNSESNVFIISDHGSTNMKGIFFINSWLRERGYLIVKGQDLASVLDKVGLNKENLKKYIDKIGLGSVARRRIPNSLGRKVPRKGGVIAIKDLVSKVDWDKSTVIATGQGPIFINRNELGDLYENFRENLIRDLKQIKDPLTGKYLFSNVFKKEEIYFGKYLEMAPDIYVQTDAKYYISGSVSERIFDQNTGNWKAENSQNGIFVACGPFIKQEKRMKKANLIDIAPTILHMMGLSVPEDMDGNVLKNIFKDSSEPKIREIKYQKPGKVETGHGEIKKDEEKKIKERLRSLGYLE